MSSSTYAVCVFGYKINSIECRRLELVHGDGKYSIIQLISNEGKMKLPDGFDYYEYHEDGLTSIGIIVGVDPSVASSVLCGDSCRCVMNMYALSLWIRDWGVRCDNTLNLELTANGNVAPMIHVETYTD